MAEAEAEERALLRASLRAAGPLQSHVLVWGARGVGKATLVRGLLCSGQGRREIAGPWLFARLLRVLTGLRNGEEGGRRRGGGEDSAAGGDAKDSDGKDGGEDVEAWRHVVRQTASVLRDAAGGTGYCFLRDLDCFMDVTATASAEASDAGGEAVGHDREGEEEEVGESARVRVLLLAALDALRESDEDSRSSGRAVVVVATTSFSPDRRVEGATGVIPAACTRTGRFDLHVHVPMPSLHQRVRILRGLLLRAKDTPPARAAELAQRVAEFTPGFVATDLVATVRHALRKAMLQQAPSFNSSNSDSNNASGAAEADAGGVANLDAFLTAARRLRPLALTQLDVRFPAEQYHWDDFVGYAEVKEQLQRLVVRPRKQRELFAGMGVQPSPGVLLHGPSGCGKSFLAQVLAAELAYNLVLVRPAQLLSQYLGESEARLRRVFAHARAAAPCMVFLDELDALAPSRQSAEDDAGSGASAPADSVHARLLSTLLNEMDGISTGASKHGQAQGQQQQEREVLVVGATNRVHDVDAALLRKGRLHEHVHLGPPSSVEDAVRIMGHLTRRLPLHEDVDIDALLQRYFATKCSLPTPADMCSWTRQAAFAALAAQSSHTVDGIGPVPGPAPSFVVRQREFDTALQLYILRG